MSKKKTVGAPCPSCGEPMTYERCHIEHTIGGRVSYSVACVNIKEEKPVVYGGVDGKAYPATERPPRPELPKPTPVKQFRMGKARKRRWNFDGQWEFGEAPQLNEFVSENLDAMWESIHRDLTVHLSVTSRGDIHLTISLMDEWSDNVSRTVPIATDKEWVAADYDHFGDREGAKKLIKSLQRFLDKTEPAYAADTA